MTRARSHRFAVGLVVLLLAIGVSACDVVVDTRIQVAPNGTGVVTVGVGFDDEALARVPDLESRLRLDDLQRAGWVVEPLTPEADGHTWLRASKHFSSLTQAEDVLAEVAGDDGPFSDLTVTRANGFGSTTYRFAATADFSEGLDAFSDAEVTELLGGVPLGGQLERIEAETGRPAAQQVAFRFTVDLPGAPEEVLEVSPTASGPQTVRASGEVRRSGPIVLAGIGIVLALVSVGLLVFSGRALRRSDGEIAAGPVLSDHAPGDLEIVVLDTGGVVLEAADDVGEVLVPFLWEAGVAADEATIRARHREVVLGRLAPDAFWRGLGFEDPAGALVEFVLFRHRLAPGVREFVRRMAERGVRVAVFGNDAADWAARLALLTGLDTVDPWVTSAELGVTKPDPAAYEALARRLGVAPGRALVIDDELSCCNAAASVGFATAWFQPDPVVAASPDHVTLRSFDLLDVVPRTGAAATGVSSR